jgi:protein-S-isoprenylcysteine O-methyltransferase Ste14
MEVSARSVIVKPAVGRDLPLHRVGDVALFLIWIAFAVSGATGALGEVRDGHLLAATHQVMVAAVFLVNATLFLLRGPAVRRSNRLDQAAVALVGSWTIAPLSMLPFTWHPDWLLGLTSLGMIGAYAFVLWALFTLRRSFSIIPEARKLVRHGPYALVRHPLYAAYITTYVLIAVPRLGPWALLLVTVGIGAEVLRARNEERLLAASFIDYADYAATTPRFVPRVA